MLNMFKAIQEMFQQMSQDVQSWKPIHAIGPGQNETYAIEACHSDGDVTSVPLASDASRSDVTLCFCLATSLY